MIRDRGKLKMEVAFFMPEQVAMINRQAVGDQKLSKPILDEHKIQELNEVIHYAMKYGIAR